MIANKKSKNRKSRWALGASLVVAVAAGVPGRGYAANLDAHSNTKVNNAKAKAWSTSKDVKNDPALQKQVVNVGSRRNNTCTVNVGTAKPGEKAPKEIVVTTKEVINVCK